MHIFYTNSDGDTDIDKELISAAAQGDVKLAEKLIDRGADINSQKHWTQATPLHVASREKQLKVVELLLERKANTELLEHNFMTPLLSACSTGGVVGSKIAILIIEGGANIHYVRDADGMTALKFSIGNCKPEVIERLLTEGVKADSPICTDQTALMLAARKGDIEAISLLMKYGADINYPCGLSWARNKTALWHAVNEKRKKAISLLRSFPHAKMEI
jgi:ankyrin repeat protein